MTREDQCGLLLVYTLSSIHLPFTTRVWIHGLRHCDPFRHRRKPRGDTVISQHPEGSDVLGGIVRRHSKHFNC